METKYGIISDVHEDPRLVIPVIELLKSEGAEKLVLNGDIGKWLGDIKTSQDYTAVILEAAGRSGLETYAQPGSHEKMLTFGPVMNYFADKYDNLFTLNSHRVENPDHHLVFLPGSDSTCEGEYHIGQQFPTGNYVEVDEELIPFDDLNELVGILKTRKVKSILSYFNTNDLRKTVTAPEKTIVFSHIPRRFYNSETGIDMAEFGLVTQQFKLNDKQIEKNSIFPMPSAAEIAKLGAPVELRRENAGSKCLEDIFNELKITKAVSGHIHESGHKACDNYGHPVKEGELVDDLFWNSGCLDLGQTGILHVRDGKVAYQNIKFRIKKTPS